MKKVTIKFDHWLPKLFKVGAITLRRTIYFSITLDKTPKNMLNHEMIHIRQIRENGLVKFYLLYIIYYFFNLLKYRNHMSAYRNIKFEVEAYRDEKLNLNRHEEEQLKNAMET